MKNPNSHIYLYAKHWYKRSVNEWDDIRRILDHSYLTDDRSKSEILHILTPLVYDAIVASGNPPHFFRDLIADMVGRGDEEQSIEERTLRKFLSILEHALVRDNGKVLLELDAPDPDLLPLAQDDTLERWDAINNPPDKKAPPDPVVSENALLRHYLCNLIERGGVRGSNSIYRSYGSAGGLSLDQLKRLRFREAFDQVPREIAEAANMAEEDFHNLPLGRQFEVWDEVMGDIVEDEFDSLFLASDMQ